MNIKSMDSFENEKKKIMASTELEEIRVKVESMKEEPEDTENWGEQPLFAERCMKEPALVKIKREPLNLEPNMNNSNEDNIKFLKSTWTQESSERIYEKDPICDVKNEIFEATETCVQYISENTKLSRELESGIQIFNQSAGSTNMSIVNSLHETQCSDSNQRRSEMYTKSVEINDKSNTNSEGSRNTKNKKGTTYICEICKNIFQTMGALRLHSHFHIKWNGVTFTCSLCGATFKSNKELINHKSVHDSEDLNFKCKKCKLDCSSHHDYLQHIAKHIKTPPYKCVECSDTFHLQSSYKSHISTHFVKQVKCNLCQATFTQTKSLEKHKKRYHRPGVVCVECGKSCPSRRELVGHMVNHTGVRVFQCLYCGEGFYRPNGRSVHMRIMHTNFIPHQCTICSEKFYTAHKLKIHMTSHDSTRQKKYECNDCGKRFLYRSSMITHAKRHAENIRYYCPMCERSYSTYHNLCVHAESAHVNIERHKCELCNASFILESMLRSHYRSRNHQNKVYAAQLRSINVKE